jgi:hypothetical protein
MITGPTNCSTFSSGSFGGTSCAAPNIAGAAAVRWDFEPVPSATVVCDYILEVALTYRDWGDAGNDVTFGHGGLYLEEPADVTIRMMTGLVPPVDVPAGSSFTFAGVLANNTAVSQTVDVGLFVRLPGGNLYGPLRRFDNVDMEPSEVITVDRFEQDIPVSAPEGMYRYMALCGVDTSGLVDADSFRVLVYHRSGKQDTLSYGDLLEDAIPPTGNP